MKVGRRPKTDIVKYTSMHKIKNKKRIIAPIILAILLVVFFNVFMMFPSHIKLSGLLYSFAITATAIISVAIAHKIWPSSPYTVAVVLLIVLVIREFLGDVYFLNWYAGGGQFWGAFLEVVKHFNAWHRILLPLVAGISTSFVLKYLAHHSRESSSNAAP